MQLPTLEYNAGSSPSTTSLLPCSVRFSIFELKTVFICEASTCLLYYVYLKLPWLMTALVQKQLSFVNFLFDLAVFKFLH